MQSCPACRGTGVIAVRSSTRTGKGHAEYDTSQRPCPMGCVVARSDRLKGNEMSLDQARAALAEVDEPVKSFPVRVRVKRSKDYAKGEPFDVASYYGFKKGK